jgi:hypothetical protein
VLLLLQKKRVGVGGGLRRQGGEENVLNVLNVLQETSYGANAKRV